MKKEDLDQVLAIESESFTMPWTKNLFLSEFRSPSVSRLMVALDALDRNRTILGFLVFWLVSEEMHILNIAVSPRFRRRGIARFLVLAGLRHGYENGARKAFLEVRVSNRAAQKLYAGLGFTPGFIRKDYYDSPPEAALVMSLEEGAFRALMVHSGLPQRAP